MADSRELTFGMDFDLDETIQQLGDVLGRLQAINDQAEEAEAQGRSMGQRFEAGTEAAAAGARDAARAMEDLGDEADDVGTNFRAIGREADSFGSAIAKSMGTAAKESGSATKTIRAGFDGAIGYTEKKFTGFTGKVQKGIKGIGTAFTHPISTIKGKFLGAVEAAADRINGLGDEADDARKDIDDMGDEGDSAGSQIKDAIKGALTAFIGFEAIQAGIDMLKELGAAAAEAAGAAENTGRKFEANFAGTDAADWAENYADAVHRSTDEVKSFMVSNKAMYGELGITGEAATELSKITTSLAYDFGNAFAMDDAEALAVVQDYISGNTGALEEYGVHIDDVTLKNTAMEMGLGDQLDALDEASLAQVRMNALLDESSGIQQAAANSTGGLVNSTKDLKGIWSEFMADAGAKFTPVIESLFGAVMDSWPTIEPMLMQFVDILSNGMAQAAPILIELGQTLIPTLTSVIGTLFQAGLPLIDVFGQLAQTILPPLASVVGMIAETVMPPLVDILGTLNTAIIQPLVPLIQKIAEAFLPPIAQLLGAISPILEAISPVLSVIGDVLGVIADVLGTVVGWLADGVSSVVGFFTNLFGGAKESEAAVNDLNGAVNNLDETASAETSLAVDTSQYKEQVEGAAATTTEAVTNSSNEIAEITDVNFIAMGASATSAYASMQTDAETAWAAMQTAASTGADNIVAQFNRIAAAAQAAASASNIQVGTSIPHNAEGTDNFEGGATWMNEEGGELAILPGGSAIIPADQTDRLMRGYAGGMEDAQAGRLSRSISNADAAPGEGQAGRLMQSFASNNTTQNQTKTVTINPTITITLGGGTDPSVAYDLEARLRAIFQDLYKEAQEADYTERIMQHGYA